MHFVVDIVGGALQFFEKRVEKGEESVNGGEAGNGGVTGEVNHCFVNVFISDVFCCSVVVLLLVDIVEFLPNIGTNGVLVVF